MGEKMKEKIELKKLDEKMYIESNTDITWVEFDIDYLALEEEGVCWVCGKKIIDSGFRCLDGGDEVCYDCVEIL